MARFDFAKALAKRTNSIHTQRAYYRWVDRYLVDFAGFIPSKGPVRARRMAMLTVSTLERHLTERKLFNWLQRLMEENQSRQALDQARAAIVTLSELFYEAGHMDHNMLISIQDIHVPKVEHKAVPERLLSVEDMQRLANTMISMAGSENQRLRNAVIVNLLWGLALRRDEISALRWRDVMLRDGKPSLMVNDEPLEMSRSLLVALDQWRRALPGGSHGPNPDTPLLRRIWKGGRIARDGLSPDGVWLTIHQAAAHAGLGAVTPDDLRRSVAAQIYQQTGSVEEVNKLLRHRSLVITERFLARIGYSVEPTNKENIAKPKTSEF
ncbi:tyrosine-type recombinase/integrase [Aggregatilineales bacterium SYSU G02658]